MPKKQIYILNSKYESLASTTKGLTFHSAKDVKEFLANCGITLDDPLDAVRLIKDGERVTAPAFQQ